jgi:hypothetical protein
MSAIGTKRDTVRVDECPLSGVKRTCQVSGSMSAYDPKRTLNDQLQNWWSELVPPYGSSVLHPLHGTSRDCCRYGGRADIEPERLS